MRSRRIFKTTSAGNTHEDNPMEVDALFRKEKGKGKSAKEKKGGKKGKDSHTGRGCGATTAEHSRFDGECRNCRKHGHKAADCWYKQQHKPPGKGKGSNKTKSKVTQSVKATPAHKLKRRVDANPIFTTIMFVSSEHDRRKLDAPMMDCGSCHWKTARNVDTVSWKVGSWPETCDQAEEHQLMIDSGCFEHVCPP